MRVIRNIIQLVVLCLGLTACSIVPVPMTLEERDRLAEDARLLLFADQEALSGSVTLNEATARAIRYYADYRLRQMEEVLASAQLDVSRFDMLPRLTSSIGYSTRNNDSFGFGFSPNGGVAANPSASTERSRTTANLGFSWNILDFGVSYYRAKQQADQVLAAKERRRKAQQMLAHDVRVAWFRAEAAQRLLPEIDKLMAEIELGLEKTRLIESRKLLAPAQIISMRRALVEVQQQISFRRQELAQAQVELAALINVPPGSKLALAPVPEEWRKTLDITADLDRLDAVALRNRPDLGEEGYKSRISELEAKRAMVALLPGLSFDVGGSYDSNRFLLNNTWTTAGWNIAYNLFKVFSIPATKRSAEAQRQLDEMRRSAVAMAILAQTRIASVRYTLLAHEHGIWQEAARDDAQIAEILETGARAGVETELELLRARSRAMVSRINRDLSFSNVQATVGQLFQSMGLDIVDDADAKSPVPLLAQLIASRLGSFQRDVFRERADHAPVPVAMGPIAGVEPPQGALLSEGMERIFKLSDVRMADSADSRFRIALRVGLQPPTSGAQTAQLSFRVIDSKTGEQRHDAEFRTTLSTPVDDEQLRVLGEAAAYRVLLWMIETRGVAAGAAPPVAPRPAALAPELSQLAASLDGGAMVLRLAETLDPAARFSLSRQNPGLDSVAGRTLQ